MRRISKTGGTETETLLAKQMLKVVRIPLLMMVLPLPLVRRPPSQCAVNRRAVAGSVFRRNGGGVNQNIID